MSPRSPRAYPSAYFHVAVPFPGDAAPFKVIRTYLGKSRIVDAAQTREDAERRRGDAKRREREDARHLRR